MANAERKNETLERYVAALFDRREQIAHRSRAKAFLVFKLDLLIARRQRKDIGRLLDPFVLEEQFDLFLAQAFDVEGAARDEQLEMLDLLIRAGELAAAVGARTLLAGRGFLAHHVGVQMARAFLREMVRLG